MSLQRILKGIFFSFLFLIFEGRAEETGKVIMDDEIESILTQWVQKIFTIAGIKTKPVVLIIIDPEVNAGATFGGQIIVFTGLILKCQTAAQLLGVLAHEVGHIAGAHSARAEAAQEQAMVPALAATLLGGAAALVTGNPGPLIAGAAGGSHVFERGMMKHSRSEENSADSAALHYLDALGCPAKGLYEFLGILNSSYTGEVDPYTSTHPLTEDRRIKVKLYQPKSKVAFPIIYEEQFQRMKAKIKGFTQPPSKTLQDYPLSDQSIPARYARSIAHYRSGNRKEGLEILKQLLKDFPKDPSFFELRGQMYFEQGCMKEAIQSYREALHQNPRSPILNLLLAQVLIESPETAGNLQEATVCLNKTLDKDPQNIFAWRLLAAAYGKQHKEGHKAFCLAQEAWIRRETERAKSLAKKAEKCSDSAIAQRARDILNTKEEAMKN